MSAKILNGKVTSHYFNRKNYITSSHGSRQTALLNVYFITI